MFMQLLAKLLRPQNAMKLCTTIISVVTLGGAVGNAYAQTPQALNPANLSHAERNICQDLDMCVDILLRHDPDGFDYTVLAQDFQRFGQPAMQRLLQLMVSDRIKASQHAQYILLDKNWQFTAAAQDEIAKSWPSENLDTHKDIMINIGTPLMRNRAISTLLYPNGTVRAQSRRILQAMAIGSDKNPEAFTAVPVPPAAFPDLVKAASDVPTLEIIRLIGSFPQEQSKPVLSRFLLSEEGNIASGAYEQLYRQNPDMALSVLTSTLPQLKTTGQALALSQLLQGRHSARQSESADGFYMHFAHNVLMDEALPVFAHMMAMDAVMNSVPLAEKTLPDAAHIDEAFATLLKSPEVSFVNYAYQFDRKTSPHTARYLPLLWDTLIEREKQSDRSNDQTHQGIYAVSQFARSIVVDKKWRAAAVPVLRGGLAFNADWRVQHQAALGLGEGRDKAAMATLKPMAQSHPILDVRAAAISALSALTIDEMNTKGDYQKLKTNAPNCPVAVFDFKEDAKQLPFFDDGKFPDSWGENLLPAHRRSLTTAYPTQSGWLAGYSWGERGGGLLYYDNVSGKSEIITGGNIISIVPVKPTPLGTFATEFWVIDGLDHLNHASARVFYIRLEKGKTIMRRHYELPAYPRAINVAKDQSLQMGFANDHPPLRLLPNGNIISGCVMPNAGAAQTLPN
ncbi:MAG: HEAT repeat domain-containing protein [Litorimonas sp.]